jgi:hypothetical protein
MELSPEWEHPTLCRSSIREHERNPAQLMTKLSPESHRPSPPAPVRGGSGIRRARKRPCCFRALPCQAAITPSQIKDRVAISGHGWWEKGTCSNNLADVYNCLYEYYTDGTWRRKACSDKIRLKPKSVGGRRTTARRLADTGELTSWRNHVDVDVVDEWDTAEWPYRQAEVERRVYGADQ